MSANGEWVVCVDFGTAFSKAAAAPAFAWTKFDAREVRPLALAGAAGAGNRFLLPSAIFVEETGIVFGGAALARAKELGDSKRQALQSFKTILSAKDLDNALGLRAMGSVDPTRSFSMRDLVVLYLAFLIGAAKRAVAADEMMAGGAITWRYASPAWREDRQAAHTIVQRLFGEAYALEALMGEHLAQARVTVAAARAGLDKVAADATPSQWRMDMVYEASGAAACSAIALADRGSHVIVLDMGAGTTDIAALANSQHISGARITLIQAGDFLDRTLLNLALAASPQLKTPQEQTALWNAMMPEVRDLKETMFTEGRALFRHGGKVITLHARDFERDKEFKVFQANLARAYVHAMRELRERARRDKAREILAVAAGGGAGAPFVQKMVRENAPGGGVRHVVRPATPEWAHAEHFAGNLAPVFPQLAVAIGGALAPRAVLGASGAR